MKFTDPVMPKDQMKKMFDDLHNSINKGFNEIGTQSLRV
jgi:hypothetical protein